MERGRGEKGEKGEVNEAKRGAREKGEGERKREGERDLRSSISIVLSVEVSIDHIAHCSTISCHQHIWPSPLSSDYLSFVSILYLLHSCFFFLFSLLVIYSCF